MRGSMASSKVRLSRFKRTTPRAQEKKGERGESKPYASYSLLNWKNSEAQENHMGGEFGLATRSGLLLFTADSS
jgi:hypothetical protein